MTPLLQKGFGTWSEDCAGLPCYDLYPGNGTAAYAPFSHIISTGRFGALLNQWGNCHLLTCEAGTISLTPNTPHTRSGLYPVIEVSSKDSKEPRTPLLYAELAERKGIRYGIGFAEYRGSQQLESGTLEVKFTVSAAPDESRQLLGVCEIAYAGSDDLEARFAWFSDVWPRPLHDDYNKWIQDRKPIARPAMTGFAALHPHLGSLILQGEPTATGETESHQARLWQEERLSPGTTYRFCCRIGLADSESEFAKKLPNPSGELRQHREKWAEKTRSADFPELEGWRRRECRWTYGYLHQFNYFDRSVDSFFTSLGGYGFMPDPHEPEFGGFGIREACENVMVYSEFDVDWARHLIKWTSTLQLENGDIPKSHNFLKEKGPDKFESDNEAWYLLAVSEYLTHTEDFSLLNKGYTFWKGEEEQPLSTHLAQALLWILEGVGRGSHGQVLFQRGDWNDYLSNYGKEGRGESVMNTAILARAVRNFLELEARGMPSIHWHTPLAALLAELQEALEEAFDQEWFVRGYDDDGQAIGSVTERRCYLNAQSWCALAKAGSKQQRQAALKSALKHCHSPIGLTLMSRPHPSPPPLSLTDCPIPSGEGENAGIWPQTVHWAVWALSEEGMLKEAQELWDRISLQNHSERFPGVPFGIFNGPDCYSSHFAGAAEGWTQYQVYNRIIELPMNPMIAWQAFSMRKILLQSEQ